MNEAFQMQTVCHYTDTTESHGGTCYHGIQQEAVERIEYTGSNGDTYYIINKCPE